ncbi:universal stress protein [Mycobacterium paraterrae]|uniref:Universal stress protein n=1 Tax=Mycobacterium paraterrae TaxID=577492 RepID=A0ABY3VRR7_9MYCO|nr:universal stress protein [Mycobacterium paraterrae]UMB71845.1 universal stress protein [Mycobacterium paraterrae]
MSDDSSPRPVVVAVDGSDAALSAASWAAKEAVHHDVPLKIVYVAHYTCGSSGGATLDGAEQQYAESCLREASSAVKAAGLLVTIETEVLRGDVGATLVAESVGATLVCVGSTGIGRMVAAAFGSTAITLAERAHCPVAIIRYDAPHRGSSEAGFIVAVLDGLSDGDAALVWAMEEARVRRAPVLALGIFPWPPFDTNNDRFYDHLDHWLRRYPDVTVEVATTRMSARRYLESFAGAIQLVVIGQGDAATVTRLIGPRRLPITAHANCSVLIAHSAGHQVGSPSRVRETQAS